VLFLLNFMNAITKYLKQNRHRYVEELKTLVRFASVSAKPQHADDCAACAAWLAKHLRSMGLCAKLHRTKGHSIITAEMPQQAGLPTVLIYGHYDVQPPEPLELWRTPPFAPTVRGGKLFGRGASDNKGQFFAHVKAVEAYLQTGTPLPVNVIFLIEGEEETGSLALGKFVKRHGRKLRPDYIVVSDTGMFSKQHPTVTLGTRGIAAFEIRVDGPSRDLHSGVFGGSVTNPAMTLARLLAGCVDAEGCVTVSRFYDDVRALTVAERREMARLPFDEKAYAKLLGVPSLAGEKGQTTLERRWARPTFEVNGIYGGYQGEGSKTIVPAWAGAKISCRLVPGQNPQRVYHQVRRHLERLCPASVRLSFIEGHHSAAHLESRNGPGAQAATRALARVYGRAPVFVREGGSLPILNDFKRWLGGEIVLVGLGLPDDNWHSPNEKMDLGNYQRGIASSVELLRELAV
jgi:acetylornithine deacetylase/succinyl-diaminopimelate desuccinylase-like protein